MINIKTDKEIKIMMHGGKILAEVLLAVMDNVIPGVSELEIDALAERLIREKGGESGFKKVDGYSHTICVSTNDVVVHGIPTNYIFKEGDVVGIDCGVYYEGFHTDMAETRRVKSKYLSPISKRDQDIDIFLKNGKKALEAGIAVAKSGNKIGNISKSIQDIVEKEGNYSIVRTLIGHGVGRELHEEPEVPGFLIGKISDTPNLIPGITIAIEVIYNMGKKDVIYKNKDGWSISTKDKSISGLFERSVLVGENGPIILTK
ncbi:methionine aminopeptidase [Candidatus Levyibacteriota bacterium]|nr:type I methionyl aminopeptidase [Candidatus Levybacteria bacterium]MSU25713.1 type I methionyl aminopeptidase [Candidatus Levybacteria bacterium]GDX62374.1 methionine aminopeptidase [Candidatus Levybacteria bacterium]